MCGESVDSTHSSKIIIITFTNKQRYDFLPFAEGAISAHRPTEITQKGYMYMIQLIKYNKIFTLAHNQISHYIQNIRYTVHCFLQLLQDLFESSQNVSGNTIVHRVTLSLLTCIGSSVGLSTGHTSDHSDGALTHDRDQNRVKPVSTACLKLLVTSISSHGLQPQTSGLYISCRNCCFWARWDFSTLPQAIFHASVRFDNSSVL